MLDTVKPTSPAVKIVPGPFRRSSVDPEGAAQARTFQYKVVRITKSCTKVLGVSFAQYLCTGFGNAYNFVLERSSEYTIGVPQSSTKRGVLSVYQLFYFDAKDMYFLRLLLYDVGIAEKKDFINLIQSNGNYIY